MTYLYSIFAASQPNCTANRSAVQVEFVILYLATSTNFESQLPEDTQQEIAKGPPIWEISTGDATLDSVNYLRVNYAHQFWGCIVFFGAALDKIGYCLFP